MQKDVVIIGAGPAGIFTALELLKKGSRQKILIVEKGRAVEDRRCPKDKAGRCVNCKPYCHITTGFSGAGASRLLTPTVPGPLPILSCRPPPKAGAAQRSRKGRNVRPGTFRPFAVSKAYCALKSMAVCA